MDNIDQKKVNKELKFGVILSYFLIALNIVSGLLLVPFIIRGIGQSNYGIYTAAASLIAMFLVDLGLGTAVTKFISKYRVLSNQTQINKVVTVVFVSFLCLSAVLLVIFVSLFPFLGNIYSSFTAEELKAFRIVYIIVASYSVLTFPLSIVNGMLVSYDKIFLTKLADIISKLIFIGLTIVVLVAHLGLYFLTACYAVHGIVSIVLKVLFVKLKTPTRFFSKVEKDEFFKLFKEVIMFSIWAAINSFGRVILVSIAPTILGFTSSTAQGTIEIAIFAIAVQIESYVSLFATAFGSMFYPSISRILFGDGEDYRKSLDKFKQFHIKIARIQVIILAIFLIGLTIFGKEFVYLWVGLDYKKSYYCILAVCLPALIFYPLQTAENAMAAIEKIKYCGYSTIISTIVGIGASIGFAFAFGAIGVSLGICVGFILRTVLFNVYFKKYLEINPFSFYFKSYMSFLIPIVLTSGIGIALNMLIPGTSWLMFLAKALVTSVVYVVLVCLIGLNKEERTIVDSHLKQFAIKCKSIVGRLEK